MKSLRTGQALNDLSFGWNLIEKLEFQNLGNCRFELSYKKGP